MSRFVRVNMTEKKVVFEEVPEKYAAKGGRWLTSLVVNVTDEDLDKVWEG